MKATRIPDLVWADAPDPVPGPNDVMVRVHAAGVNRADLLQARGHYPPPPGASDILGLEVAGVREDTGERVCALLPGGGYAERAAVHRGVLLPMAGGWSFAQGAAVPEVWLTAFVNLFLEGGLQPGETALIHAGASGVGLAAIQLARDAGARVLVTVRSESKHEACRRLGAEVVPPDHNEPVDVIVDCVGGSYLADNIRTLRPFGRLVIIGLLGGSKAEMDLAAVLRNRLKVVGSTLRSRPRTEHVAIVRAFRERFYAKLLDGTFEIPIDRTFPIREAAAAHAFMGANQNTGKIILTIE